jgi:hypothetical protein
MTFNKLINRTLLKGSSTSPFVSIISPLSAEIFNQQVRTFAVTGRHSKNVAGKKNKLDAMKTKLYNRLGVKIIMVILNHPGTQFAEIYLNSQYQLGGKSGRPRSW